MRKLNNKTGFTLAELLIVVAIIAILVAIGIPAFSTAMERSRETVDLSNIRGAYAEFMAGTLGGAANTGYYKVNIKQRDCSNWIVDTNGFLSNIVEWNKTDAKYVTPIQMPDESDGLKTGEIWVRFTTTGGITEKKVPDTSEGAAPDATVTKKEANGDAEKPILSFVESDDDGKPTPPSDSTMKSADMEKVYNPYATSPVTEDCVVAPLKEKDDDPTTMEVKEESDWYLTIEGTKTTT